MEKMMAEKTRLNKMKMVIDFQLAEYEQALQKLS
jgi:hypothetical protein